MYEERQAVLLYNFQYRFYSGTLEKSRKALLFRAVIFLHIIYDNVSVAVSVYCSVLVCPTSN